MLNRNREYFAVSTKELGCIQMAHVDALAMHPLKNTRKLQQKSLSLRDKLSCLLP